MNYKSTTDKTKHTTTLLNSIEQYKKRFGIRVGADEERSLTNIIGKV